MTGKRQKKFIQHPGRKYIILNPDWVKQNYPDTYKMIQESKS